MVREKVRAEKVAFVTTGVDQMSSEIIPESFAVQKIPDMSLEGVKMQKDHGTSSKYDETQKIPGTSLEKEDI